MWQPLADDLMAGRCWDAVEAIRQDLAERPPGKAPEVALANGPPGQALFFSYLAAAREDSETADLALEMLGRSIQGLGATFAQPSLYGGFCGVGWTVEHLTREHIEKDGDLCESLDDALETVLSNPAVTLKYELINGLAGFGLYLVERRPHPAAEALLPRILDRLEASAEETPDGLTWFTRPEWVSPLQHDWMPDGGYNLGVAHGVPGVIGFLAAARREGFDTPGLARLAEGAVHWVLAQRYEAGDRSVFPAALIPGEEPGRSRTAWCYGDLGIAAVLLSAARSFDRLDWEVEALAIARRAAARPAEAFRTTDACLCHGTVGIAHLFNRLHQATGDPDLRRAALDWYGHALSSRQAGKGIGGFLSWMADGPGEFTWRAEPGFLAGATGVGLGLLAAATDVEPSWDRVMLLAIPPRAATA